jgi:large subunit ribosomal protein L2
MGVRKLRPTTPGQRHKVIGTFEEITESKPLKSLTKGGTKSGGRNNTGKMTMRYIGGGHKRKYRLVDFKRDKHGVPARVETVEYDPNRSARIALLTYADGDKRYIIAPEGLKVGQTLLSGSDATPDLGNALFLSDIPLGTVIHNIEMTPGKGGSIARSAGSYAQLNARDGKYAILKMPSGETRMVLTTCMATIGTVSNSESFLVISGKAGRSRWLVMNPVDHPMGGGEGRSSGGHPRSRKGIPSKGYKTRAPKNTTSKFIIERRKK